MITEQQYRARMYWLASKLEDDKLYKDNKGHDRHCLTIKMWANDGLLFSGTLEPRMRAANHIYKTYIKDIYHDE